MNKIEISNTNYKDYLNKLPKDGITVFTLENDSIRGILSSNTNMVAEMATSHKLGLLETMVLGKAYVAASLLSATIKGDDKLIMKVNGSGPARGFSVECNALGDVRGYLFAQQFELPSVPDTLDTAPLIGHGTISITRYIDNAMEPVTGSAELKTGRIAEDLAWYYHISEQTATSFSVGVHFNKDGTVAGAGGLLLQALPGASDEALDRVERLVAGLPALGKSFAQGLGRLDICLRAFPFFDYNHLDEKETKFYCPCSREKLESYLKALPDSDKADISQNGPFPVAVTCHNCGSEYTWTKEEFSSMQ